MVKCKSEMRLFGLIDLPFPRLFIVDSFISAYTFFIIHIYILSASGRGRVSETNKIVNPYDIPSVLVVHKTVTGIELC